MTEQDQSLVDVLKWAINPNLPTPAPASLDSERLVELVQYHRILGPLIRRVDAARPPWFPRLLLTRLRLVQHHVRQSAALRMDAAREITVAMRAAGQHPPIIIKGFAAYALTNHPDLLHFSSDIDPFAEDLPAFWEVLHTLGYTGKRKDTHEWAKLMRGAITLDIHQHYPVNSYPDDVRAAPDEEMQAWRHPGHWRMPMRSLDLLPSDNLIRWSDLKTNARHGIAPGTEDLLFPSPAMLCLIHCAHCFRSAIVRLHYMMSFGDSRLFEMLSLHALAQSPDFDAAEFYALVNRYAAQDAVHFADKLLSEFFGTKFPATPPGHAPPSRLRFLEHLPYGGWVMTRDVDNFLLDRELDLIFQRLGSVTFNSPLSLAGNDLPRLLLYGPQAPPPLNVSVDWNAAEQTLRVCWESLPVPNARQEFLMRFGHNASVKVWQAADGSLETVAQKPNSASTPAVTWHREEIDRLTVTCQLPAVPGSDPQRLPVFFAMRRLSANGEAAATYLPVILHSPSLAPVS